ncbi:hypothetical protein HPB47_005207 [Ixodes persulcatus]|uniref:Uncharacterized protein n=1 Tax=Ixodes persulcatus TaxID=34615 RepID=A0AC60PDM3_IXOPE|nr:hypothetical protein HPB47_005207 [Ixodes persulcatus]
MTSYVTLCFTCLTEVVGTNLESGRRPLTASGFPVTFLTEVASSLLKEAKDRPSSPSLVEVVREEVHRAFQPETPVTTAAQEEPALSYAAMVRRAPPAPRPYMAPPRLIIHGRSHPDVKLPEEEPVILTSYPTSDFSQLPNKSRLCGVNNSFVVMLVPAGSSQSTIDWVPRDYEARGQQNQTSELVLGSIEEGHMKRMKRDSVEFNGVSLHSQRRVPFLHRGPGSTIKAVCRPRGGSLSGVLAGTYCSGCPQGRPTGRPREIRDCIMDDKS